jgi:uncharacterized membrane protein HdeD (DUF308 family)
MDKLLTRSRILLAVCAALEATYALVNLFMLTPEGSLSLRLFTLRGPAMFLGAVAIAAGACAVAAGLWNFKNGKSWLLILNGLALSGFGLIPLVWNHHRLSFRPFVALLFVVMAVSIGVVLLTSARAWPHGLAAQWTAKSAGAAMAGFGLLFLAVAFRVTNLPHQPAAFTVLMSSYFGISAICMLVLALRNGNAAPRPGIAPRVSPNSVPSPCGSPDEALRLLLSC